MTHQEIADRIQTLNIETSARREAIDAEHKAQMLALREECRAIGHIFANVKTYFGGGLSVGVACVVCGTSKADATKECALGT